MKEQNNTRSEAITQVMKKPEQCQEIMEYTTVRGLKYDEKGKNLIVYLPGNKRGILPYEEASIIPYKFSKKMNSKIPIQIYALLGSTFKVKVIGNSDEDQITVSRRIVQNEFLNNLNLGEVINAKITKVVNFGIFVDIGEGIPALLPITQVSRARIYELKRWFSVGDYITVKINEMSLNPIKIVVSRKDMYLVPDYKKGDIIEVRVCKKHDDISYFVEINPACTGIMDILDFPDIDLHEGETVQALVKRRRSEDKYSLDLLPL